MHINNFFKNSFSVLNEQQVLAPDRTNILLSVFEHILKYIPGDVNNLKLLSTSFRFAVEKIRNPLFKIGPIFANVISETENRQLKKDLEKIRSQLREFEIFLKIEDYKNHVLRIAKTFVYTLNTTSSEIKKLINDLMKAPIPEAIEQAIELVSVIKDPSARSHMLISLAKTASSQITPLRAKVRFDNLARITELAAALENPQDRSEFIFGTLTLIDIVPVASNVIPALVSIVDALLNLGDIAEDQINTEVLRSSYHALDVAMRLLEKVPEHTLRNSRLERFFEIFSTQIETAPKITNDGGYDYNSLLSSFYGAIQMIKALPIEVTSIATPFLRRVGLASIGPKEETKNRFLSRLSATFAHAEACFQMQPDQFLRREFHAIQTREFPQGIQRTR